MARFARFASVVIAVMATVSTNATGDEWARTYGGSGNELARMIRQTPDGGYIVAGHTEPIDSGDMDSWVLKLDGTGAIEWQKSYGGSGADDDTWCIQPTVDHGYIMAGFTESFGAGWKDFWVLKLDGNGDVSWQRAYGGINHDRAFHIEQTADEGYVVAGYTESFGAGQRDYWVLKLDSSGGVLWEKTYGGIEDEEGRMIKEVLDDQGLPDGYILSGFSMSFTPFNYKYWVLRLDGTGGVFWSKIYGGDNIELAGPVIQTEDGDFLVGGYTTSFGVDVWAMWLLKLDGFGNIVWERAYWGNSFDYVTSIDETSTGEYLVTGRTDSFGAGSFEWWVLWLDRAGNIIRERTYGGTDKDTGYSIQQIEGGGVITAGRTDSFGVGASDFCVLKLDDTGNIPSCDMIGASVATVSATTSLATDTSPTALSSAASTVDTSIVPENTAGTMTVVCDGNPIPTVSEWGLAAMTLLMLSAGTVVLKRRQLVAS